MRIFVLAAVSAANQIPQGVNQIPISRIFSNECPAAIMQCAGPERSLVSAENWDAFFTKKCLKQEFDYSIE